MKKNMRRVMSMLLVVFMLAALLPVSVMADEAAPTAPQIRLFGYKANGEDANTAIENTMSGIITDPEYSFAKDCVADTMYVAFAAPNGSYHVEFVCDNHDEVVYKNDVTTTRGGGAVYFSFIDEASDYSIEASNYTVNIYNVVDGEPAAEPAASEELSVSYVSFSEVEGMEVPAGAFYMAGESVELPAFPEELSDKYVGWEVSRGDVREAGTFFTVPTGLRNIVITAKSSVEPAFVNFIYSSGELGLTSVPSVFNPEQQENITLPASNDEVFSRFGWIVNDEYVLDHWERNGESLDPGAEVVPQEGDVFTAIWRTVTIEKVDITLDANGGIFSDNSGVKTISVAKDSVIGIINETPTRENYNFVGWAESASADEEDIIMLDTYTAKEVTLYAVWKESVLPEDAVKFDKVEFRLDDSENAPVADIEYIVKYAGADGYTLPTAYQCGFAKPGYVFVGWKLGDKTFDRTVTDADLDSENVNVFCGVWERDESYVIVNLDANGGSVEPSYIAVLPNESWMGSELNDIKPVRDGFNFLYWATDKENGIIIGSNSINLSEDITIYAIWEEVQSPETETYTVCFRANNGTDAHFDNTYTVVEGQEFISTPSASDLSFANGESAFLGWSKQGGDGFVAAGESIPVSLLNKGAETVFLAKWEEAPVSGGSSGGYVGGQAGKGGNADTEPDNSGDTEAPTQRFSDVPVNHWAFRDIETVAANGWFNGVGNGIFAPADNTTRAQVAAILFRLSGSPSVTFEQVFEDVPANEWFSEPVVWANANGVVTGISDSSFAPLSNVTREQIAAMLWRLQGSPAAAITAMSFNDSESVSDWASDAMLWAVGAGLFIGDTDNNLRPADNATRAEIAAVICRYAGQFVK